VLEVDEHLEPASDDGVGGTARDIDDEPDAAGVVLERRIVKTDALGRVVRLLCHALLIAEARAISQIE
jgi:hypothetical protein